MQFMSRRLCCSSWRYPGPALRHLPVCSGGLLPPWAAGAVLAADATAAVVQALAGLLVDGGIYLGDAATRTALLCLILLPTVGGHTLAMYLLRHVKSQMVTLSVPAQFILGTLAAVVLFHETPTPEFLAGALVVMAGVVLGVLKREPVASA